MSTSNPSNCNGNTAALLPTSEVCSRKSIGKNFNHNIAENNKLNKQVQGTQTNPPNQNKLKRGGTYILKRHDFESKGLYFLLPVTFVVHFGVHFVVVHSLWIHTFSWLVLN